MKIFQQKNKDERRRVVTAQRYDVYDAEGSRAVRPGADERPPLLQRIFLFFRSYIHPHLLRVSLIIEYITSANVQTTRSALVLVNRAVFPIFENKIRKKSSSTCRCISAGASFLLLPYKCLLQPSFLVAVSKKKINIVTDQPSMMDTTNVHRKLVRKCTCSCGEKLSLPKLSKSYKKK